MHTTNCTIVCFIKNAFSCAPNGGSTDPLPLALLHLLMKLVATQLMVEMVVGTKDFIMTYQSATSLCMDIIIAHAV